MQTFDTIFIKGLSVRALIGCYEHEKTQPQTVVFDIDMAWQTSRASSEDKLEYALDYDAVARRVEAYTAETQVELVETLAEQLAGLIMSEFHVPGLRLRVTKPEALVNASGVGVLISRGIDF